VKGRALSTAIAVAIIAALFARFGVAPVGDALGRASASWLIVYALLTALVVAGYAARWRVVAAAMGAAPPFTRLLRARLAGDAVGALVPSARLAGDPVRIALSRTRHIPTAHGAAIVAADRILELIGNLLAVLASLAVVSAAQPLALPRGVQVTFAAGALAGLLGLLLLVTLWAAGRRPLAFGYGARARRAPAALARWCDALASAEDHVGQFCREHRRAFVAGVLASALIETAIVAQHLALLTAFGLTLGLPTVLLIIIGGGAARVVPTPAALGAMEAVHVAIVGAVAGRGDLGFAVGLVLRLHETLLLGAGLIALTAAGLSLARLRTAAARAA
jgi:uncharacterized protein (TIRG00374 family)